MNKRLKILITLSILLTSATFSYSQISTNEILKKGEEMGITKQEMVELYKQQDKKLKAAETASLINNNNNNNNNNNSNNLIERENHNQVGTNNGPSAEQVITNNLNKSELENQNSELIKSKQIFGLSLFSSKKVSFEPNINMPTPANYILSTGDEVIINVWGDSEISIKETISPEGTIMITGLGPISLNGLSVDYAKKRIELALSKINSTIGKTSNLILTVGKIRSIKIHLTGEVINPGTYTVPSLSTVLHVLHSSGGTNEIGDMRNIEVYRNSRKITSFDLYDFITSGSFKNNIVLKDSDVIVVKPYFAKVHASGAVKRSMFYQMKKNDSVGDLIDFAGNFKDNAYKSEVRVYRRSGALKTIHSVTKDNFKSFLIEDGDSMVVDLTNDEFSNIISISGAIWRPGDYPLNNETKSLLTLITKAGGLKGDAFTTAGIVTRRNTDYSKTFLKFKPQEIISGAKVIELKNYDEVYIPTIDSLREKRTIITAGELIAADTLDYVDNMKIEDAIILSGGLTNAASLSFIEVSRILNNSKATEYTNKRAEIFSFIINEDLTLTEETKNFSLLPNDLLIIRSSPHHKPQRTFTINGEVITPGIQIMANEQIYLSDIIELTRGVTPQAHIKGTRLSRKFNIDTNGLKSTLIKLRNSLTGSDTLTIDNEELESYSVAINLDKAIEMPRGKYDIRIEAGDVITIPKLQNTVNIIGGVYFPNATSYTGGKLKEYIYSSGGYTKHARKRPYVVYPNGTVKATRGGKHPIIEPGCIIIVPMKNIKNRMSALEIASLVTGGTSLATSIASLGVVLK